MGENSITRYYIAEENLVGRVKERKSDYDLMAAVMICLGKEEDFHIRMTQALEREVSFMCNLSKGVEEKGKTRRNNSYGISIKGFKNCG